MSYTQIAKNNFKKFSYIDGNQYIASEYALITILKLIDDFKVKSILEVGLGIGSISDTVFKYANEKKIKIQYTGTESNEFCLNALKSNIDDYDLIDLHNSIADVKNNKKFDLIIIDGSDDLLNYLPNFCNSNTVIYIEGYRNSQVESLKREYPNLKHVEIISSDKNPKYGPFSSDIWSGGGQLIFLNPTLINKFYWFNEKINSFLKRRLRKFKK